MRGLCSFFSNFFITKYYTISQIFYILAHPAACLFVLFVLRLQNAFATSETKDVCRAKCETRLCAENDDFFTENRFDGGLHYDASRRAGVHRPRTKCNSLGRTRCPYVRVTLYERWHTSLTMILLLLFFFFFQYTRWTRK